MNAISKPIAYERVTPQVFQDLLKVQVSLAASDLDRKLICLVTLRASQMNQCAFCVKMHVHEALEAGETEDRLARVIVWRRVSDFSAAEKAALAWTEILTDIDPERDYAPYRAQLAEHFTEEQISYLTITVAMINLWNRIQLSKY